jgi:hypothetical protein
MVEGFRCCKDNAQCDGVRVAIVIVHGGCVTRLLPMAAHCSPRGQARKWSFVATVVAPPCVVALLPRTEVCFCHRLPCPQVVQHCLQMIRRDGGEDDAGPSLSTLPPSLSTGVLLPELLPMAALSSSLSVREEGGLLSPQSSYPPMPLQRLSLLLSMLPLSCPMICRGSSRADNGLPLSVWLWSHNDCNILPIHPYSCFQPPPSPLLLLPKPPPLSPS